MERKQKKQWENKKIWKWTLVNLFLILFGVSIIANVTFMPKYFALKNRSDHALKVDIKAYNETGTQPIELFYFQYQSTMATLGDLMSQYSDTYKLKKTGALGRFLEAISYIDENGKAKTLAGSFSPGQPTWMIYYKNELAPVGIDSLYLEMNTKIELKFLVP